MDNRLQNTLPWKGGTWEEALKIEIYKLKSSEK